jgi:hypothetical protein
MGMTRTAIIACHPAPTSLSAAYYYVRAVETD